MANSLLDFVISLVRDPEVAARYAANPAQALADAHLTGVTSVDVNNLIPMVSDSLSMAGPVAGMTGAPVADHGNVWASGAATAAFDAFTPHTPVTPAVQHSAISGVINQPSPNPASDVPAHPQPAVFGHPAPSELVNGVGMSDPTFDHGGFPAHDPAVWDHSVIHPDAHSHDAQPDHHGFGDFGVHG